ncbi:outer membrane beta-barrel protein [candidate division KSB1 bacterium]|nr:outer membrane beta-barrel protein [candidate division KSB1 bacterium]
MQGAHSIKLLLLISFALATAAVSQGRLSRAHVGLDYGVWKPSALDAYPNQPIKNIDGAAPYLGFACAAPRYKGHALRVSLMQWQQRDLVDIDLESVTLRHLSFDLKYLLLPDYKISPYVSYGVAAIWSRERPNGAAGEKIPLDRTGWGFNLGAGIDFLLGANVGLGIEYQYSYAVFAKRVGLTDNYSGPKIAMKLFYIF